jgi:hypothetical protein
MAKKSSRSRQQGAKRQSIFTQSPPQAAKPQQPTAATSVRPVSNNKTVNFVQEYFYVYQDLRSLLLVSILMFAVLMGLSFAV